MSGKGRLFAALLSNIWLLLTDLDLERHNGQYAKANRLLTVVGGSMPGCAGCAWQENALVAYPTDTRQSRTGREDPSGGIGVFDGLGDIEHTDSILIVIPKKQSKALRNHMDVDSQSSIEQYALLLINECPGEKKSSISHQRER